VRPRLSDDEESRQDRDEEQSLYGCGLYSNGVMESLLVSAPLGTPTRTPKNP